ncbi:MAG: 23S rRNA (uracil(1939)-C(5))-methyltransferase RlmD, partial [Gammaproteobacteria bacterium]|nr:23S rRNA (uracil(1939)-C(5))-methyltransferase RlmD [Gammaproteobacteria bacterium]
IADIDSCEVLESKVAVLLKPLAELIQSLSIMDRLPQIEVAVADNITALVLRVLDPPTEDDLRKLNDFAALSKVEFYLQSGGIETISPLSVATPLSYKLPDHDIEIFFEPSDFIQINADMNNRMLNHALELLKIKNTENVLDLFCGLGNFTLPIAKHAARVDAVEGDAALVKRARHNAKVNNIENIAFHLANLFESVGDFPWSRSSYDAILLDPPRAGAKEIVVGINQFNAQRILYVSCHPGTLARDAGTLVKEHGYELKAAGIMDMFPHTAHVESIALFARS